MGGMAQLLEVQRERAVIFNKKVVDAIANPHPVSQPKMVNGKPAALGNPTRVVLVACSEGCE